MEFRFDLKPIFSQPIVKIGSSLLPNTFQGDRRTALDTSTKMQEIINTIGEFSAKAQGLTKPVTTAQKLRQSENHKIYLLIDADDGNKGSIIGMLKVGKKSLYVFNEVGVTQMVEAPCILDFYIHESRQRAGLGKDLFETMLQEEQWQPLKLAIDRPSDKLLAFLRKHYGLEKTISQMNNFVIYEGFFDQTENGMVNNNNYQEQQVKLTSSPNTALFGPLITSDDKRRRSRSDQLSNTLAGIQNSPIGRYAATRPTCSMAELNAISRVSLRRQIPERRSGLQNIDDKNFGVKYNQPPISFDFHTQKSIIHSSAKKTSGEPNSPTNVDDEMQSQLSVSEVETVTLNLHKLETSADPQPEPQVEVEPESEAVIEAVEAQSKDELIDSPKDIGSLFQDEQSLQLVNQRYRGNKQHTGMKNMSFGVGAAVTPTTKMEFYQENPEDFGVVKINHPAGKSIHSHDDNISVISSIGSGEGFTGHGYYDLKFHHNKLW